MTLTDKLNGIRHAQKTIDELLSENKIPLKNAEDVGWFIEPLYNEVDCNIGFGNFPLPVDQLGEATHSFPPHYHKNNKEYLICVRGSAMLNIDGNFVRKLKVGDCALLHPGEVHYSKPLEKDTKIVYVCVPADPGYLKAFSKVK